MAVVLDGSNDFYLRSAGLRLAQDGKVGTFACWFRRDAIGTNQALLSLSTGASERLTIGIGSADIIFVAGINAAGGVVMVYEAATALIDTTKYHHLVTSWDLENGEFELFVDREDDLGTISVQVDDEIDYTGDTVAIGAVSHDGSNKFEGRIDEVFLDINNAVDLDFDDTRLGNVELGKFVSQDNTRPSGGDTEYLRSEPGDQFKVVGYGVNASLATDDPPIIYVSGSPQTFRLNRGGDLRKTKGIRAGGDFVVQGAPTFDRGPNAYRKHAKWPTHGMRWFESERSGFLYPRGKTFIEHREGVPSNNQRLGTDELDAKTREERPGMTFSQLIFRDREDDQEERDR